MHQPLSQVILYVTSQLVVQTYLDCVSTRVPAGNGCGDGVPAGAESLLLGSVYRDEREVHVCLPVRRASTSGSASSTFLLREVGIPTLRMKHDTSVSFTTSLQDAACLLFGVWPGDQICLQSGNGSWRCCICWPNTKVVDPPMLLKRASPISLFAIIIFVFF